MKSKVEVEQALLEAEMESEVTGLQQEKDALEAVHDKMTDLETKSQQEKEKVNSQRHVTVEETEMCASNTRRFTKTPLLRGWK